MVFFLVVLPASELLHFLEDLFAGFALLKQLVESSAREPLRQRPCSRAPCHSLAGVRLRVVVETEARTKYMVSPACMLGTLIFTTVLAGTSSPRLGLAAPASVAAIVSSHEALAFFEKNS